MRPPSSFDTVNCGKLILCRLSAPAVFLLDSYSISRGWCPRYGKYLLKGNESSRSRGGGGWGWNWVRIVRQELMRNRLIYPSLDVSRFECVSLSTFNRFQVVGGDAKRFYFSPFASEFICFKNRLKLSSLNEASSQVVSTAVFASLRTLYFSLMDRWSTVQTSERAYVLAVLRPVHSDSNRLGKWEEIRSARRAQHTQVPTNTK